MEPFRLLEIDGDGAFFFCPNVVPHMREEAFLRAELSALLTGHGELPLPWHKLDREEARRRARGNRMS